MKSKIVIYPGTFDPITYGHLEVIKRAKDVFSEVVIAVAKTSRKKLLFSLKERLEMVREAVEDIEGVRIKSFSGLVVDFARENKAHILIRGLRMISDFEYEFQMALTNRRLAADIETVFLMPSENHSFISSTLLKETAALGADISSFVPGFVEKKIKDRIQK